MNTKAAVLPRDGTLESPWQQGTGEPTDVGENEKLEKTFDCLIAGGGITGFTAGLLLQTSGQQTVIAEAHTIGFGTTGGTSAHINTFADTTYMEAESAFGEKGAQLFASAINEGFAIIKNNIDRYGIDCDFECKTGYLFAETDDEVKQLDDVYKGALKVGVPVSYVQDVPTNVAFKKALQFDGQAQFHPLKYLKGLQEAYQAAGGVVVENTKIDSITKKDEALIAGGLKARTAIYATHMPPNINLFNFECAPYRSYVMAVKLKSGKYPDALLYDMQEPYHYVRSHTIDGEDLLIAGGHDHKTGHEDPAKAFADLEKYIRNYYNVAAVKYKWSSQYYVPVDGLPYVGEMPMAAEGIYCATGFNGNGMMLGSISAKILSDLVTATENPYTELFKPSRIKPIDSFAEFAKENADVAFHWFADRLAVKKTDSLNRLQPGSGKVVEVEGRKIAAYKDEAGNVHVLSAVCTHAACIVNWNSEEKSWDCPCHGARFDVDGHVLTGPATIPLQKAETE
jgi:glycine/D-amino acid oxidase-like deaminating enzyme/nitrite reductase/ring-hydroxylating ferredoxin subunit